MRANAATAAAGAAFLLAGCSAFPPWPLAVQCDGKTVAAIYAAEPLPGHRYDFGPRLPRPEPPPEESTDDCDGDLGDLVGELIAWSLRRLLSP